MCDLGKQSSAWAEAMQVPTSLGPLLGPIRASARVVPPRRCLGALTTSLPREDGKRPISTHGITTAPDGLAVSRQCSVLHVCVCGPPW